MDSQPSDNRLFDNEDVVEIRGQEFECTAVNYSENEQGKRVNFSYTFRLKSEMDDEREAEEARQRELEEQQEQQESTNEEAGE